MMNTFASFEFTAYIGIDWADTKHDICIQPAGSDEREFDRIAHDPKISNNGRTRCINVLVAPSRWHSSCPRARLFPRYRSTTFSYCFQSILRHWRSTAKRSNLLAPKMIPPMPSSRRRLTSCALKISGRFRSTRSGLIFFISFVPIYNL